MEQAQVPPCPHPAEAVSNTILAVLACCGVRDVVYCPGSRSAPLAYALDRAECAGLLRAHLRLDERSAAFLAVGLSRGTAAQPHPVALITTSGGAVAELHAGVAEASHARLPLIILSADRPFEMRGVGASQTTAQPGIFGPHVRGVWDVPAGIDEGDPLPAIIARAVAVARGRPSGEPGPVQVNVGLRDPLIPSTFDEGGAAFARLVESLHVPEVCEATAAPTEWTQVVDPQLRTIILAGDGADPAAGQWARAAGVPLLAEPSSGLCGEVAWLPHEQSLLSCLELTSRIEQVVVTGRPTLSRVVSRLLARPGARIVVQCRWGSWPDVAGRASVVVADLATPAAPHEDRGWLPVWQEESARTSARIATLVTGERRAGALDALRVAREVWAALAAVPARDEVALVVGASNSVRALDLVAARPAPAKVIANRGLAGIDGTVATAIGVARSQGQPVCALMGDLTFFHDAGALALAEGETAPDLLLVVVDDRGGSIFATLEHGSAPTEVYDRWFRMAQSTSIADLCRAYGIEYVRIDSVADLRARMAEGIKGIRLLHVPVESDPSLFEAVRNVSAGGQ